MTKDAVQHRKWTFYEAVKDAIMKNPDLEVGFDQILEDQDR